jgi:hypothetical protein
MTAEGTRSVWQRVPTQSVRNQQEKGNWRFLGQGRVRLSKVGDVKIKLHRPLEGECKTLTVQRDTAGNWYGCFRPLQVSISPIHWPSPEDKLGIQNLGTALVAWLSLAPCRPLTKWLAWMQA